MKLFLTLLTFTGILNACGCLDPQTAQSGADSIIKNYDQADASLTASLEKFFTEVTYHYDTETYDFVQIKKSLQLLLDETLSTKEDLFDIDNQVELR